MLFPKPLTVISFLVLLYASSCANDKPATTVEKISADSATVVKRMEGIPDSAVFNFLRWYAKNVNRISEINLVNNNGSNDSTKFYSVNFPATEIYLNALKESGFISGQYINTWHEYFKKRDEHFKSHPQNEGPPEGFDYDLVMQTQDIEDIYHLDKATVISKSVNDGGANLKIRFLHGQELVFLLSKPDDAWLIDKIDYEDK